MKRWFGIPIDNPIVEQICLAIPTEEPVPPERRHLTLAFCSQRDPEQLIPGADQAFEGLTDCLISIHCGLRFMGARAVTLPASPSHSLLMARRRLLGLKRQDSYAGHVTIGKRLTIGLRDAQRAVDEAFGQATEIVIPVRLIGLYSSGHVLEREWAVG